MSRLSSIERAVLRCAGTPAAEVAAALGVAIEQVQGARVRCGRNGEDGLPGSTCEAAEPAEGEGFFAAMMKSNRGVC